MATVNRLKKKKEQHQPLEQKHNIDSSKNEIHSPLKSEQRKADKINPNKQSSEDKQKQYESYYQINESNPHGISVTCNLFPQSSQINAAYGLPLGFCFSPLIAIQNETNVMRKSVDKIPKCSSCQAYMNCYNIINKKKYKCFLCDNQNLIKIDYNSQNGPNDELKCAIYQAIGPSNLYAKQPTQQVYIFLIDVSVQSYHTKMLYYAVAAMKQVLSRQQLDDLQIYFFTFDETIHEYDFSGEDVRRIIFDPTILESGAKRQCSFLGQIRKKLFSLLDNLEELSKNNNRPGYSFTNAFSYIYSALSYTGGRFFILQCSEAVATEPMFMESKVKEGEEANSAKILSYFQTRNKEFFQKYTENMLKLQCSISFFTFAGSYKNLKTIHDCLKLTSSELKYYRKQTAVELEKFYYEFSYFLGCSYYKNVRVEFILSRGWNFTGVYGNFYRIKNSLIFQINSLQPSRKMFVLVSNSPKHRESSYCCLQIITNYRYKRQSFISVATIVQPVTGILPKLYASIDIQLTSASLAKQFFSALRMDTISNARKKLFDASSKIYSNALLTFKKVEQFPEQIMAILKTVMGMIKSVHSQPEIILSTPLFDRVISERNFMQFSSAYEFSTYFNPYLFDLSNLEESMCRFDIQFTYPPSIEAKFQNIQEGLFLLDNGLHFYLFIARQCEPHLLSDIFGNPKITKKDVLTQEIILKQNNLKSSQVLNLIKVLREQKSYSWAPLYIVKSGENTELQREFYLNFYTQKYDEFKVYNITVKQFLNVISKQNFH